MMINSVSFFGQIRPQNTPKQTEFHTTPAQSDTFVRTKNPQEESIAYAKNKIIDVLRNTRTEYGITIGPDGTILDENQGDEHHCTVHAPNVAEGSYLLHGHPQPLPLSSGDVSVLLTTGAKVEEAVMEDGKFSRLTKKHPFKSDKDYLTLYGSLEKQLRKMVLDSLGIDYKMTRQDLIQIFKDFLEYNAGINKDSISDEEAEEMMPRYGFLIDSASIEDIYAQLKDVLWFPLLTNPKKYDKEHHTIIENQEAIENYLDTQEGLMIRHKFLQEVAKAYDLDYETNLFE